MKKPCRKCAPKANSRPLFNFGEYPETDIACREFFYKSDIFGKRIISKSFRKLNFIFLSNSMLSVCHSYVIRMSLVCTRISSVCYSYVLVCHPYVTRISLVCTRMSSVCHSYVTRMYSYVMNQKIVAIYLLISRMRKRREKRKSQIEPVRRIFKEREEQRWIQGTPCSSNGKVDFLSNTKI